MAEKGAATNHAFRETRLGRIEGGLGTPWIVTRTLAIPVWTVPVQHPFPHVSGHVVQTVSVRRERTDRCGAPEAVFGRVQLRETPLPDVRQGVQGVRRGIPPGEPGPFQAAAGGKFPFGLGRKPPARPLGIGHGVVPRDVSDRVPLAALDRGSGPFGLAPVRPGYPGPPGREVRVGDRVVRGSEAQRSGYQQGRVGTRKIGGIQVPLGHRHVSRSLDEGGKLRHRDLGRIHPEAVHPDLVGRSLVGPAGLRTHHERRARDPGHPVGYRAGRRVRRPAAAREEQEDRSRGDGAEVPPVPGKSPGGAVGAAHGDATGSKCSASQIVEAPDSVHDTRCRRCGAI